MAAQPSLRNHKGALGGTPKSPTPPRDGSVTPSRDRPGAGETRVPAASAPAFQEPVTCRFGVTSSVPLEQTNRPDKQD